MKKLELDCSFNGPAAPRQKTNVHVHLPPNFSAFDSIDHVIDLAASEGIAALGASNYYFYELYEDFARKAQARGITPLFGLEIISLVPELVQAGVLINDPGNPGRMYICGKGITKFRNLTPKAYGLLSFIRARDQQRMAEMTRKVASIFKQAGYDLQLTDASIIDRVAKRHSAPADRIILQERHIAQAFQEVLFDRVPADGRAAALTAALGTDCSKISADPVAVQTQIRSSLMKSGKPAFVKEEFLEFSPAYDLILELGGIPCYPTLADGASKFCGFEEDIPRLIGEIKGRNLHMAEYIPIRNTPEVLTKYVKAVRAAGIAVVAGTEHNTLDLLPIEPKCLKGAPVPDEVKDIFWEGTCVIAAHLYLTSDGQKGFVDSKGMPHNGFTDSEQRIRSFADLGARVISGKGK
jgi:hypothetical protein